MDDRPNTVIPSGPLHRVRSSIGLALSLVALAAVATWAIYKSIPVQERQQVTAPNESVQAIREVQNSQQQIVDQLKTVQETVSSDHVQTNRLLGEVSDLKGKLEALQQSVASAQQPQPAPAQPQPEKRRRGPR